MILVALIAPPFDTNIERLKCRLPFYGDRRVSRLLRAFQYPEQSHVHAASRLSHHAKAQAGWSLPLVGGFRIMTCGIGRSSRYKKYIFRTEIAKEFSAAFGGETVEKDKLLRAGGSI